MKLDERVKIMKELGVEVVHLKGQVVQAWPALVEVLGDRGIRRRGHEQLHLAFPGGKKGREHRFASDFFPLVGRAAEDVAEDALRRLEVLDGDADVVEFLHAVGAWGRRSAARAKAWASTSSPSHTDSMSGRSITSAMMPS